MRKFITKISVICLSLVALQGNVMADASIVPVGLICGMAVAGVVADRVATAKLPEANQLARKASQLWVEPVPGSQGILTRLKSFPKGRYGRILKMYNKVRKRSDRLFSIQLAGRLSAWAGGALCLLTGGVAMADDTVANPHEALENNSDFAKLVSAVGMDEALTVMKEIAAGENPATIYGKLLPKIEASAIAISGVDDNNFLNEAVEENLGLAQ